MRQKDIVILAAVIIGSGILSLLVSNYIFNKPANRNIQVETATVITTNFTKPSSVYFNTSSIDPTQTINVTLNSNQNVFGNTKNGN
jgi:hypothetical protein